MQPIQKIFIGFVAFCAALGGAIGLLLYASAIPYFFIIGKFVAGLLITALVCAAIYIAVRTLSEAGIYIAKLLQAWQSRRLVVHGEIASYRNDDGTWMHLSVEHEKAKIPRLLPAPDDEPPFKPDEQDIINIYNANKGVTLKQLGAQFQMSYSQVEKIYADAKKRGLITR